MNIFDWYWFVGQSAQVYSSGRNVYVSTTDAAYVGWQGVPGNVVQRTLNEAELWKTLRDAGMTLPDWLFDGTSFVRPAPDAYSKSQLRAYAAMKRFEKEVSGASLDGVAYPSDRETQAKMTSAVLLSQVNPAAVFKWKVSDGNFVTLNAAGILSVASAIGEFVQNCFAQEGAAVDGIADGTITTTQQVDAVFV